MKKVYKSITLFNLFLVFNNLQTEQNSLETESTSAQINNETSEARQAAKLVMQKTFEKDKSQIEEFSYSGENIVLLINNIKDMDLPNFYTYFRLINNYGKQCVYIESTSFNRILEALVNALKRYYSNNPGDTSQTSQNPMANINSDLLIEQTMLNGFLSNYGTFQSEPDSFLTELSQSIDLKLKSRLDAELKK